MNFLEVKLDTLKSKMCVEIRKPLWCQLETSNQNWSSWATSLQSDVSEKKNVIRYDACSMSGKSWLSRKVTQDAEQNDITGWHHGKLTTYNLEEIGTYSDSNVFMYPRRCVWVQMQRWHVAKWHKGGTGKIKRLLCSFTWHILACKELFFLHV